MKLKVLFSFFSLSLLTSMGSIAQDVASIEYTDCSKLEWEGRTEIPMLHVVARYPKPTKMEIYKMDKRNEHHEPEAVSYILIDTTRLPGETTHFLKYLNKQIKYPRIAIECGIQGKVFFTFEVDSDGYTRNFQIKRGLDKFTDNQVHSAVMKTPKMVYKEGELKDNGLPEGCYRMAVMFELH